MAGVRKRLGSLLGPRGVMGPPGPVGGTGLPGVNGVLNDDASATNLVTATKTRAASLAVARQAADETLYGPRLVNALSNPSFETNTVGWTAVRGVLERVPVPAVLSSLASGSYVAQFTADGTGYLADISSARMPVTPGAWVTARAVGAADAGLTVRLLIFFRDAAGTALPFSGSPYVAATTGQVMETVQQAPASAVTYELVFRVYSGSSATNVPAGSKAFFDAFMATVSATEVGARTALALGYRDGSSTGWRRVNTTNASFSESVPVMTSGNLDLYVTSSGDDRNDGSLARPVRTIARVCQLIPRQVLDGHVVNVRIGAADWNETLRVENISNRGQIIITGLGAEPTDTRFNQALLTGVDGYFELVNLAVKERFSQAQFWFKKCPGVTVTDCVGMGDPGSDINASGRIGFLSDEGSSILIRGTKTRVTYKRYFARANRDSKIYSDGVDPSLDANGNPTNLLGLAARLGGILQLSEGTQPRGVEQDVSVDVGGLAIGPRGFKSNMNRDEEAITDQWTTRNSPVRKKFYAFRKSNVPAIPGFTPTRKLRLIFDGAGNPGPLEIEVRLTAQISDTQVVYQHKRILATLGTALYVVQNTVLDERFPAGYVPDKSTVIVATNRATVSGTFNLDVFPQVDTVDGMWGVDIAISHMGSNAAPRVISWGLA